VDDLTLGRYLAGEGSGAEVGRVERWQETAPRNRRIVGALRAFWQQSEDSAPGLDLDGMVQGILSKEERKLGQFGEHPSHRTIVRSWVRTNVCGGAALSRPTLWRAISSGIVALVAILGLFIFGGDWQHPQRAAEPRVYRTAVGEEKTIRLADGSTVRLAPATTATVTPGYIDIVGEAYFTVTANTARPVIVTTRNAQIRVLGTRYSVRHYSDESRSRVVVDEGRVSLHVVTDIARSQRRPNDIVASAGTIVQVSDSGAVTTTDVAASAYTEWSQDMLVFKRVPLGVVVTELARAYGAEIHVADSVLAKKTLILDVSVSEQTLPQVLAVVSDVLGAECKHVGDAYVLTAARQGGRGRLLDRQNEHPQTERHYGQ